MTEQGYNTFIFGGCEGFDIKIAKIVNFYKTNLYKNIKLVCAVPFRQQADAWSNSLKNRYYALLDSSDEVITLSDHYYKGIYHVRNRFMVENSSLLIGYFNGTSGGTAYTFNYATKQGLKIRSIDIFPALIYNERVKKKHIDGSLCAQAERKQKCFDRT